MKPRRRNTKVRTFVAVLGDGKLDLELTPEMQEWLLKKGNIRGKLNSRAEDRVLAGVGMVRKLAEEGDPASGLIFTSGLTSYRLGCTVASAMEQYVSDLFPELEHSGFIRPPVVVNRTAGVSGLIAEMRWAYREAQERCERPRIEFIASPFQVPFVHLANLSLVWVPNYWVRSAEDPIFR